MLKKFSGLRLLLCCVALSSLTSAAQDPLQAPRYGGVRWQIAYGSYEGVQKFSVNELQRALQQYLPYVLQTQPAGKYDASFNLVLIGTAAENPLIAQLETKGLVKHPAPAQSYTIACIASPWQSGKRLAVIDGADSSGVLFGAEEFNKKLALQIPADPTQARAALDSLPYFSSTEFPAIENRGIWSWGYVIYDYRRFLDNMARLKMNRLIVWNDVPPVNAPEFLAYAHSRGIAVVFGFSWGWGTSQNLSNPADLAKTKQQVLQEYERNYSKLDLDGIYFQTLTERSNSLENGRSIATLAAQWVNEIGLALLQKHPKLRIEFGLHASSIKEHYAELKALDPRIVIVWEDAGVLPYSYDPAKSADATNAVWPPDTAKTLNYSKQLVSFRPHSEFSMVAKGWTKLDWDGEFEHHGPFILGERSESFIAARALKHQARWNFVNELWMKNYPDALLFFQEMRKSTTSPITVTGLIEDGLFEECIQPSAALFGEMLWNPNRDVNDFPQMASNPYFASSASSANCRANVKSNMQSSP